MGEKIGGKSVVHFIGSSEGAHSGVRLSTFGVRFGGFNLVNVDFGAPTFFRFCTLLPNKAIFRETPFFLPFPELGKHEGPCQTAANSFGVR